MAARPAARRPARPPAAGRGSSASAGHHGCRPSRLAPAVVEARAGVDEQRASRRSSASSSGPARAAGVARAPAGARGRPRRGRARVDVGGQRAVQRDRAPVAKRRPGRHAVVPGVQQRLGLLGGSASTPSGLDMHSTATSTRSCASASARRTGWCAAGATGRRLAGQPHHQPSPSRARAAGAPAASRSTKVTEVLMDVDTGTAQVDRPMNWAATHGETALDAARADGLIRREGRNLIGPRRPRTGSSSRRRS